METEFKTLSEEIISVSLFDEMEGDFIEIEDVKEFIERQIDRIDKRLEYLSEFSGLAEAELQMAELRKVKEDLIKDAGDALTK